jgi:hypothetical protein
MSNHRNNREGEQTADTRYREDLRRVLVNNVFAKEILDGVK